MAALNAAVELPTSRHSFVEFPMTANIQDPTSWGALSKDAILKSTQGTGTANAPRSRPSSRGRPSIRSKASPTIEFPPQELEAQPLSFFPPRQSSTVASRADRVGSPTSRDPGSDAGNTTQTADDSATSTSSASTVGTGSLLNNQVYSLPASTPTESEVAEPPVVPSARNTINAVKKSGLPTSKYKKKPPPSLRSSVRRKSEVDAPVDSPVSAYTQALPSPPLDAQQAPMPTELPTVITPTSIPSPPPDAHTRQGQAPLQYTKSTSSVRKARALHSHPSMPSLKQEDGAASPHIGQSQSPSLPVPRGRKSVDSSRNRPSLYELQEPSPAPNTPLPDLPPGAQTLSRPASKDVLAQPTPPPDAYVRPGTSGSGFAPPLRRQDTNPPIHAEMANYMTSNSKIIFRRFHDVHVRLLLTLQDEISALERELAEIENVDNPIDVEREGRRVKVLSELRKLLAEYDHLFSNWNLMQSSKADTKTRQELEHFLKKPGDNPSSTISVGAVDDLLWLQTHSNDLSCVDLSIKKEPVSVTEREVLPEKKMESKPTPDRSPVRPTGNSGFAAFFTSCTGKRK